MYSSIEDASRKDVIQKCYWPLFKLADLGIPIGIEAPAITIEIINELDPDWISTLSKYIVENKIEFIGSGYSQIIGPLVPVKVNKWNQKLGLETYNNLLGVEPKIALVNEMAYSGGIVEHYIKTGYEGLIMEWNNPRSAHPEWNNEWRFFPQNAVGTDGDSIPVIWADTIAFQKFQRYAHGEYSLDYYLQYLKKQSRKLNRYFPLYSNDVEIFNFRPGRYKTEAKFDSISEWDRISALFSKLKKLEWCEFVFPSEVLNGLDNDNGGNELTLESPEQPIPVKKQEKYNINRWALTGRDDLKINTICFDLFNKLNQNEDTRKEAWKELCYLWSSDFRTHISSSRWKMFYSRLKQFNNQIKFLNEKKKSTFPKLDIIESDSEIIVKHNSFITKINKLKGMTLKSITYPEFSIEPLIGTLEHGFYDDISLGADFYTGHAVIDRLGDHKIADLSLVNPTTFTENRQSIIDSSQNINGINFQNQIRICDNGISFHKHILFPERSKMIIHPFHITFNPNSWDENSLYFQTHNGGECQERFNLYDQKVHHKKYYSPLISSVHGLGCTERIMTIADKNKKMTIHTEIGSDHIIPAIQFSSNENHTFFRLVYSAQELDETFIANDSPVKITAKLKLSFEI